MHVDPMAALEIAPSEWSAALESLPVELRTALEVSVARVKTYHEHQLAQTWHYTEADGTVLGQKITALDRVGLYVPGGKARSEEHTSALQSLMRISYAVFCLKKKKQNPTPHRK